MARVEIRDLTRSYQQDAFPALSNFSLSIASGEFVVVVGPSGCGKSTALRLVAGLDQPDSGAIVVDGRNMAGVPPQDRDVAMVFQGYALYPHMRVRDILAFPLKMRKAPRQEQLRLISETAEMLAIEGLLERRPAELSGGERQRVAMGRALVRRPKVFLFDEPLSNLDAALRQELRVEIGALVRRLGATTMYVTHDHVEAMTLGDRIAVMRKGTLQQVGTPRQVYEQPENAFVASFLGSPAMNLSTAERSEGDIVWGNLRMRAVEAPERLLVGVRPEHIRVGEAPPGMVSAKAVVTAVEPLGAETHLHLDAGGATLRARLPGFEAPRRGETAWLWFDPANVHAFAADGPGLRLEVRVSGA